MSILCTRPASLMGVSRARTATDRTHPQRHLSIHLSIHPSIYPSTRASYAMPCLYCNDQPTPRVHPHLHSLVFALPPAPVLPRRPRSPGTRMHAITTRKQAKIQQEATRASSLFTVVRVGVQRTPRFPPPLALFHRHQKSNTAGTLKERDGERVRSLPRSAVGRPSKLRPVPLAGYAAKDLRDLGREPNRDRHRQAARQEAA